MGDQQQNKIENVQLYFKKVISGYLVNDISALLKDEFDNKEFGGCTVPLAMTIFSTMNQLGYLTSKKDIKEIVEKGETSTEVCIKEFCTNWMSKVDKIYDKSTIQKMFTILYRNGIAHQFLPLYFVAITRSPEEKKLISFKNGNEKTTPILQVKILAEDFLKAIKELEEKIDKATETDIEFIDRFHQRLINQNKKYEENTSELLKSIDKNRTNIGSNTTTDQTTQYPNGIN